MKIMLEILEDASQLLAALDSIEELRPETRERLKVLLEGLCGESTRLLRSEQPEAHREPGDGAPIDGERFERRCREWLLQRSLEALAACEYEQARDYLEEGAQAFPRDPEFMNHLGLVHWELGDFEQAAESYEVAMGAAFPSAADGEIDWREPENLAYLRAMEGRALCLCQLERRKEALELFDALANMNVVEYDGCRYMAAEIRHMLGDLEGAIEDYRLGPVEPATLYNLGLAQFQLDETEAAARTFIRAFVSNIHVANLLGGRRACLDSCVPGYLGSREYAQDFLRACQPLWSGQDEAVDFMETCFDHPLVQSFLEQCLQDGGPSILETDPIDKGQASWLDAITDEKSVGGLAETVTAENKKVRE